jgi:DNA-binding transcriptional MerR regulator
VPTEKKGNDSKSYQGDNNYTMAVAVKLTGIESHCIRRYEAGGLLNPERTVGNQRLFSESDVEIIKEAAKLEDEGINVERIKAILAMRRGERD